MHLNTDNFLPAQPIPLEVGTYSGDETIDEEAREYLKAGLSGAVSSQRAYTSDLAQLLTWCQTTGQQPLPLSPVALVQYTTLLARTKKMATIQRHLASIARYHRLQSYASPTTHEQFKVFLNGLKSKKKVRQKQAPDFSLKELRQAVDAQDNSPTGLRNRAILLLGFTGAFRRSELVALNIEHMLIDEMGMVLRLERSKTNQFGEMEENAFSFAREGEYCPIHAIQTWLEVLEKTSGPLFVRIRKGQRLTEERLSDEWVNRLVHQYVGKKYTAHSLRASFVTIAKSNGADDREVMNQTGHRTTTMISRYDRRRNIRTNNASGKLGL